MSSLDTIKRTAAESVENAVNQLETTCLGLKWNIVCATLEAKAYYGDVKEWTYSHLATCSELLFCMKPMNYSRTGHILFEIYVWNAWNLMAVGAMQMAGHSALAHRFMPYLMSEFMAFLMAMFIIPFGFYCRISGEVNPTLQQGRFELITLCLLIGFLSGYSMFEYNLQMYVPPAFVMPFIMGVVSNTIAKSAPNRYVHVVLVVGSGSVMSVGVAIALDSVNQQFVILFLINVFIYIIDLQLKTAAAQLKEELQPLKSLLVSVVVALMLDYIIAYFNSFHHKIIVK